MRLQRKCQQQESHPWTQAHGIRGLTTASLIATSKTLNLNLQLTYSPHTVYTSDNFVSSVWTFQYISTLTFPADRERSCKDGWGGSQPRPLVGEVTRAPSTLAGKELLGWSTIDWTETIIHGNYFNFHVPDWANENQGKYCFGIVPVLWIREYEEHGFAQNASLKTEYSWRRLPESQHTEWSFSQKRL